MNPTGGHLGTSHTASLPTDDGATVGTEGPTSPGTLCDDLRQLILRLVATPSENPSLTEEGAGETGVADLVTSWALDAGLDVERIEPTLGRPSLVITASGRHHREDQGPSDNPAGLLLCGHLDTVGVGQAGLTPRVDGDRIYGRGSYDMKAGLAAALVALREAARRGLERDIVLAAVADEENASLGIRDVLAWHTARHPGRPIADAAIVLEPTELAVVTAHRGFVWLQIEVEGLAAHGSRPSLGVDAITKTAAVLTALDQLNTRLATRAHPLLGSGFLHASTIRGGTEASTIPGRCTLVVERRTIPGESLAEVISEVEGVLQTCRDADPALSVTVQSLLHRPPLELDPRHRLVQDLQGAAEAVLGRPVPVEGASYWADSALIAAADVPTVLFGPAGEGAHAAVEWVSLTSTTACTRALLNLIQLTS